MRLSIFAFLAFMFLFVPSLSGQELILPENFHDETVAEGWDRPIGVTFDEEGRGYVWEKRGRVFILDSDGHKQEEPLIDIREEVNNWSDLGLLGFAIDPDFYENGYFYLLYVVDRHYMDFYGTADYDENESTDHNATIGRITRYTADPATNLTSVLPGSRHIILGESWEDGVAVLLGSHSVGSLVFGEDGTLMASFGDGGSYESIDTGNTPPEETYWEEAIAKGTLQQEDNVGALKSLQINNLNGSLIRIDPSTGEGIPSNPFYDEAAPNSPRSKIWATGFRNPYRFMLAPGSGSTNPADANPGTFYLGDVGGAAWEELNVISRGGQSFGWPLYEGIEHHWGFVQAPTANPYVENPLCPGEYFTFHDILHEATLHEDPFYPNPCDNEQNIPADIPKFIHSPPAMTWTGLLWNPPPRTRVPRYDAETGDVQQIDVGTTDSPVEGSEFAGFTGIPGFVYTGDNLPDEYQNALFLADLSGWIRTVYFDEGREVIKIDTFARWDDKGIVHLTYNPHDGAIYWCHVYDSELHKITFGGNPRPVALATANQYFGASPLTVQFTGENSYDPDGSDITYRWDFGDGDESIESNPSHEFSAPSNAPTSFEVRLEVTDTAGLVGEQKLLISLNNTPPQVAINSFEDGELYPVEGLTFLPLKATVTDAEHEGNDLSYLWETFLQHNNHYHPDDPDEQVESEYIIDPLGCDQETFWYRVRLTVTDAAGLSGVDERELYPNCESPFFEVINLVGIFNEGQVDLSWESTFESEIVRYEIQRTPDYRFLSIGEVMADGQASNYDFTDFMPINNGAYYRLKGVNAAGAYFYSNVIFVAQTDRSLSIFPNPTNDVLNIILTESTSPQVKIAVFNLSGYLLSTETWEVSIGSPFTEKISVADLPAGYYILQLTNGDRTESSSFVVVR